MDYLALSNRDEVTQPDPVTGQWYWVESRLACVTHVGSNYVEVTWVGGVKRRIHLSDFKARYEPNASQVIASEIETLQKRINSLLAEVRDETSRLSLSPVLESNTMALAVRNDADLGAYKLALETAKEEILPALFKAIATAHESLAIWMVAETIPLQSQAAHLKEVVGAIDSRIFSVALYAGLVENVVTVRDGAPASPTEKIRVFQRRHYMDEECLAQYETGGMSFHGISAFDAWIGRDENMQRIFPFERSIVAFQVRRYAKHREVANPIDVFVKIKAEAEDQTTFLYVRNGSQLFRVRTGIDFGDKLFPDMARAMTGKLWGKIFAGELREVSSEEGADSFYQYEAFEPSSVYYDDMAKWLRDTAATHNRVALVIQGLLDRSSVLHPHPQWQIWTQAGFESALELIYDSSRTLSAEPPDFEAYRSRLNESLAPGSITIGQESFWELREGEKESNRLDRDRRTLTSYRPDRYRPYGNPGPGRLARVVAVTKQDVSFAWMRKTMNGKEVRSVLTVPKARVFNVSAYRAGDFKQFFADPSTRAMYLQWAPFLLEAEEWLAGNRSVATAPTPKAKAKPSDDGRERYARAKERKTLLGKEVVLTRDITMKSGRTHSKGSTWVVHSYDRGFLLASGTERIAGVLRNDFEVRS